MNNLKLLIGRGDTFYNYTNLIVKLSYAGRKGAAPRSIDVTLYDSENLGSSRAKVNCGSGQTCILYDNGKEIFRGILMKEVYSSKRTLAIKAYDNCIRFCNNKGSFSYKKKRADEIFVSCCKKLGLKVGEAVNTKHVIGELIKKNTTYWDVIEDALSQTYKSTGIRYYVSAKKGKIYLKRRSEQKSMPVLELSANILSYDRTRSIENTRTRLTLRTSKGEKKGSTANTGLEKKIGKFREIETVDEDITKTEINQRIRVFKEETGIIGQELKVTATGDTSVISGGCVYVYIRTIGAKRVMYVDEDTHTFENGKHTMTLKLNYAKDINKAG